MVVKHSDVVPYVGDRLDFATVRKRLFVEHEMVHGESQMKAFAKIIK